MPGIAPQIPDDFYEAVRYVVADMFRRSYRMQGKVKKVNEIGKDIGLIYVFVDRISPYGIESSPDSWLPAVAGSSIFRNCPPDVGDIVDLEFGGPESDALYYVGHSAAAYQPLITGPGIKSLFEKQIGTDVFAFYLDSQKKKWVLQAGNELLELSSITGVGNKAVEGEAKPVTFDGDLIINNKTKPTSVGKHKHVSSAPGTQNSPMLPGLG